MKKWIKSGDWPIYLVNRWKTGIFLIYSILLGISVLKHEPWFDEAQAWLLARDASFIELIVKYLRYEGSPGLWHLILMIPAKLGFPYITLNIISAILAAAGTYLFLRYAPFPLLIKLLYPFSFFAFYQYAVIARSYSLIPLLLFSIAVIYKEKINKPFLFWGLLILLANVSVHGSIIASSLALIHLFEINIKWFKINQGLRYRNLSFALLFGLFIFLLKLQLELPKDLISVAGIHKDISNLYKKCMPILLNSLTAGNPSNSAQYSLFSSITSIISKFAIIVTLIWFALRRKLLTYLIPVFALFILFTVVYANVWHTGTLFYTWLFVLWISYGKVEETNGYSIVFLKPIVTYTIAIVLLIQSVWSIYSFRYDYLKDYSGSRELANYIKNNELEDKKIYATNFHSISILPYFTKNIFCNYNNKKQPSFWIWSHKNSMYTEPYLSTVKYDPDFIILGIKNYCPDLSNIENPFIPKIEGYQFTRFFPGALYWKNKPLETDSFALFEKKKKSLIP